MAIVQPPFPFPPVPQAQVWVQDQQERLAQAVGVPLLVTIRIVYDGFVEVDSVWCSHRGRLMNPSSCLPCWMMATSRGQDGVVHEKDPVG